MRYWNMLFDVSFIPNIKLLYPFLSCINWYPIPPYCTDVIVFASHHLANTSEIHTYAHTHTHTHTHTAQPSTNCHGNSCWKAEKEIWKVPYQHSEILKLAKIWSNTHTHTPSSHPPKHFLPKPFYKHFLLSLLLTSLTSYIDLKQACICSLSVSFSVWPLFLCA